MLLAVNLEFYPYFTLLEVEFRKIHSYWMHGSCVKPTIIGRIDQLKNQISEIVRLLGVVRLEFIQYRERLEFIPFKIAEDKICFQPILFETVVSNMTPPVYAVLSFYF